MIRLLIDDRNKKKSELIEQDKQKTNEISILKSEICKIKEGVHRL